MQIGIISHKNGINNIYLEMQDRHDRIDKRRISSKTARLGFYLVKVEIVMLFKFQLWLYYI